MITEDYVSLETAKLLKEKGFNESCYTYYDDIDDSINRFDKGYHFNNTSYPWGVPYDIKEAKKYIVAPTLQMAMKWLREEKGIAVIPIISSVLDFEKFLWDVKIVVAKTGDSYSQGWVYEKQERAYEVAIKYCLENLI